MNTQSPPPPGKGQAELWIYLGAAIVAVVIFVSVAALCYGIITGPASPGGTFAFPWLAWGAGVLLLPGIMFLAVHLATGGLGVKKRTPEEEARWEAALPEKLQRIYVLIKGAPVIVLLLSVVLLGATLLTIDGALSFLAGLAGVLVPYLPYIAGAFALIVCVLAGIAAWLRYKNNQLQAEYAFRREVLEKTGVVIVDKNSTALAPGEEGGPYRLMLGAGDSAAKQGALPPAEEISDEHVQDAVIVDIADVSETDAGGASRQEDPKTAGGNES